MEKKIKLRIPNTCNFIIIHKLLYIFILSLLCLTGIDAQVPGDNKPFSYRKPVEYDPCIDLPKPKGHLTCEQWRQRIDSVWGQGLPTVNKLQIFDDFWNKIDTSFACFTNNNINWDSLKLVYRPQIASGVSRGRFIAIMNYLTLLLRESHTKIIDYGMNMIPVPGKPVFLLGGYDENGHFGAGLTPRPDSSLLVYSVVPLHPLGLKRGDIILGYDRIPWKNLVRELLYDCQLPTVYFPGWIGSSPSAFNHSLLISLGMNWHLFDTIDVVKYSTGDTLHLSTLPLSNQNMRLFCTEQMDLPDIPKPTFLNDRLVSYGTVFGTNIGYIYVWGWWGSYVENDFYNAVQSLLQSDGIIIDFRFNEGGSIPYSDPGLSLLFDTTVSTIDFGSRCSHNHLEMCPQNIPFVYNIPGAPPGYKKPIAVLTGPGAISYGDQVAYRIKYHPKARFFGKSTAAAFNAPYWYQLPNNYWLLIAEADAYDLSNPGVYLTHKEFEVDQEVWLSQELVSQGRDDVVESALHWIDSVTIGIVKQGSEIPVSFNLSQNYPNPFNPVTKIKFSIPGNIKNSNVQLVVYDNLGRIITSLVNNQLSPGNYEAEWDGSKFSSGVYWYSLISDNFKETKKMILIK